MLGSFGATVLDLSGEKYILTVKPIGITDSATELVDFVKMLHTGFDSESLLRLATMITESNHSVDPVCWPTRTGNVAREVGMVTV